MFSIPSKKQPVNSLLIWRKSGWAPPSPWWRFVLGSLCSYLPSHCLPCVSSDDESDSDAEEEQTTVSPISWFGNIAATLVFSRSTVLKANQRIWISVCWDRSLAAGYLGQKVTGSCAEALGHRDAKGRFIWLMLAYFLCPETASTHSWGSTGWQTQGDAEKAPTVCLAWSEMQRSDCIHLILIVPTSLASCWCKGSSKLETLPVIFQSSIYTFPP